MQLLCFAWVAKLEDCVKQLLLGHETLILLLQGNFVVEKGPSSNYKITENIDKD